MDISKPSTIPIACSGTGFAFAFILAASNATAAESAVDTARFSAEPAPLALDTFPERPPPLLELGDKFLGTGNLQKGITLPTGEVISPNFWVFGTLRSAFQTFDTGSGPQSRTTEWANRLDIFGNLQFSATERLLVGWRPVDQRFPDGSTDFSGYRFEPKSSQGWREAFSATPHTLFFEGELGEMFPRFDAHDQKSLDYGFAIGRQPLTLQDGILANNYSIDMVSVTRNSVRIPGGSTLRLSGLLAWGQIERPDYSTANLANVRDNDAILFGLDAAADFPVSTVEADLLYESSQGGSEGNFGDAIYAGLGAVQRLGKINSTFRVNTSIALDGNAAAVTSGTLLTAQFSYTLPSSENLIYLDGFWGIDRFSSATRDSYAGGPLGNVGILNAAVGLGQYGAPLGNQADHAAGGALGYQLFFGELHRTQLIIEIGGRAPTQAPTLLREQAAGGIGVRFQQAFGRRFILILDTFGVTRETSAASVGGRIELLTKF
jgi:hypothetical protein